MLFSYVSEAEILKSGPGTSVGPCVLLVLLFSSCDLPLEDSGSSLGSPESTFAENAD